MTLLPLRGNALGIMMLVVSALIAFAGGFLRKLPDAPVMIAVGVGLILMDAVARLRFRRQRGWLTRRVFGGYLFVLPVWGIGLIVILINVINTVVAQATPGG